MARERRRKEADTTRLPTFIVAGAPNAGTTSLYGYLAQHPAIYMSPVKEPTFFGATDLLARPRVRAERDRMHAEAERYLGAGAPPGARLWVFDWDQYVALFQGAGTRPAVGEASVSYLWLPSAARAIRARLPEARLVFILRDPTERLFTRYLATPARERRRSFREQFQAAQDPDDPWSLNPIVGQYGTHLRRFFDLFPREQIRVHLYEDYRADARRVVRDVLQFVGVDPEYPLDLSAREHETWVPRAPLLDAVRRKLFGDRSPARLLPDRARGLLRGLYRRPAGEVVMNADDRKLVVQYYRDEILRTASLVERDLASWLE